MSNRIDELKEQVQQASWAYTMGNEIMTDAQYDALVAEMNLLRSGNDSIITAPTVGASVPGADVTHPRPMLSLDNVFLGEGDPLDGIKRIRQKATGLHFRIRVETKFDGAAMRLLFSYDGSRMNLLQAATRGDGKTGTDVTEHAYHIGGIPQSFELPTIFNLRKGDTINILGEVVVSYSDFDAVNTELTERGEAALKHPRSVVAGALNGKSPEACAAKRLQFIAYDVQFNDPDAVREHHMAMGAAHAFTTAPLLRTFNIDGLSAESMKEIRDACQEILAEMYANHLIPADGIVLKVDEYRVRDMVGTHSTAPRWAFALKQRGVESADATLLDIDWQVGRTGRITPVAKISPVVIDGVTITSVTLHNWSFVLSKGINYQFIKVKVERAGGVIPAIMSRTEVPDANAIKILPPSTCPACDAPIKMVDTEAMTIYCPNPSCTEQVKRQLLHAAGRDYMDWDGIGPEQVSELVDSGLVRNIADMYEVTREQALALDGFGEGKADNLVAVVAESGASPLNRQLASFGIHGVGNRASLKVVNAFPTLSELLAAPLEQFTHIPSFGDVRTKALYDALHKDGVGDLLTRMANYAPANVTANIVAQEPETPQGGSLTGMNVVATGKFTEMSRRDVNSFIESLGGTAQSSVSKTTHLLVCGAKVGATKTNKARSLGVEVITESEFIVRYG